MAHSLLNLCAFNSFSTAEDECTTGNNDCSAVTEDCREADNAVGYECVCTEGLRRDENGNCVGEKALSYK